MTKQKAETSIFGIRFTSDQEKVLAEDDRSPRWDLNPPQREEYDNDHSYAMGLRDYADRLLFANKKGSS
jgi:hypothetical protein